MGTFTIIIATLNAGELLELTLKSIIAQTVQGIQVIVVDGASEDNTKEIVAKYSNAVDVFICERDSGIYFAWNKALDYANGDWIQFLGAGDTLYEVNTYCYILDAINHCRKDVCFFYGDIEIVDEGGGKLLSRSTGPLNVLAFNSYSFRPITPVHPEVLMRSDFLRMHHFDTRYRFAADLKLMIQALQSEGGCYVPMVITKMLIGGMSSDFRNYKSSNLEIKMLLKEFDISPPFLVLFVGNIIYFSKLFLITWIPSGVVTVFRDAYRYVCRRGTYR